MIRQLIFLLLFPLSVFSQQKEVTINGITKSKTEDIYFAHVTFQDTDGNKFTTISDEQKQAKQSILQHPFNFIMGKAGSGKTLLACQIALDSFFKRDYNKIVVTRPTVSNEDNGFLPGSLEEKLEPWLVPIRSNMRKVYDKSVRSA